MLSGAVLSLAAWAPASALAQSPSTTDAPATSSGQTTEPAPARPGEPTAPAVPEPPFTERPTLPTERVLPAPAMPPRPTDVAPVTPGTTVPSVVGPLVPAGSAALGLTPYALLELHPSIGVSEEFTDNFRQTREKQSNFRSAVSPGLTLLINSPLTKGTISYSFSAAHDTVSSDIGLFHRMLGRVVWEATPLLTFEMSDSLVRSDEPSQADRLSLRRERRTFTNNEFSAEARYQLRPLEIRPYYLGTTFSDDTGKDVTSHTIGASARMALYSTNSLSLGYGYLTSDTSDAGMVTGHQVNASFSRRLSQLTTAGLSAGMKLRDVSERPGNRPDDSFTIWTASLFTSYTFPGRLSLDSNAGVTVFTTDSGDQRTGFSTASTLAYRFARVTAVLGVDQGFSETFELGENFGVVETRGVTGSLKSTLSPALSGSVGAFYRHNDFTGVGASPEVQNARRKETTWGARVYVTMQLRSWLNFVLEYTYTRRSDDSGDPTLGFAENRAQASLQASF